MNKKLELILLIDDDDDDNYFHQRSIKKTGINCNIDVCTSGDIALDYLTNQGEFAAKGTEYKRPNLIFLDINMPRVNGWEFLEQYSQLMEEGRLSDDTVVVILSNSSNPADIDRANSNQIASQYSNKPLKPDSFAEIVENYFPQAFQA